MVSHLVFFERLFRAIIGLFTRRNGTRKCKHHAKNLVSNKCSVFVTFEVQVVRTTNFTPLRLYDIQLISIVGDTNAEKFVTHEVTRGK